MTDFDEALRAGAISKGSTPHVESRRAPAADNAEAPEPTQARTLSETQTSKPVTAERGFSRHAPVPREGPILIISPDAGMGSFLRQALQHDRRCHVAADVSVLDAGATAFSLVICDGILPGLERVIALPLPLILLVRPNRIAEAEARLGDRYAEILLKPLEGQDLFQAVRLALAGGMEPVEV